MSTWVKICKYLDFGQNFLKISIFIKIFENIACGENCWKIWNLVKIFEKSWFWSKFTKMSILVITEENIDFSRNLQKDWFWWKKKKISILVKILGKFLFWSILMKIVIMVKVEDNLDFCQHFRIISIPVNIFGIIELGQTFPQILVLVKISKKMSIWVKIWKYVNLGQNL